MMTLTKMHTSERRKYPRVNQNLPIRVAVNGYDFMSSTRDISCVGTYCHVEKYMPPFTRVQVRLSLPIMDQTASTFYDVTCKGVVVRSEDGNAGGFNIAIFFNDIKDEVRSKISQYIAQFLPHA
jgi:c-di-GMP-binding flagellar brake protein YcgR